jgi:HSP20 family molecular chaperone IbpA
MKAFATRCMPAVKKSAATPRDAQARETAFSRPRYQCLEKTNALRLVVHVPGADPAGIDVEVNAPDLTITATRDRSTRLACRTSSLTAAVHDYQLRLRLGFSLTYDALQAELHGSTLTVTIPKKSAAGAIA